MENFDAWITRKYVEWRGDKIGRGGSISAFSVWLGIKPSLMSQWMSGSKKPESAKSINALVSRFGGEVYDVLGIAPVDALELATDSLTAALVDMIRQLTPDQRDKLYQQLKGKTKDDQTKLD